jgi:hypothetical protein
MKVAKCGLKVLGKNSKELRFQAGVVVRLSLSSLDMILTKEEKDTRIGR